MRRLLAFSLVIALVGCGGDDSRRESSTTTAPPITSTTVGFVAPSSTTTAPTPSSTSTTSADDGVTSADDGAGGEAITVTERITITIIDQMSIVKLSWSCEPLWPARFRRLTIAREGWQFEGRVQ